MCRMATLDSFVYEDEDQLIIELIKKYVDSLSDIYVVSIRGGNGNGIIEIMISHPMTYGHLQCWCGEEVIKMQYSGPVHGYEKYATILHADPNCFALFEKAAINMVGPYFG